MKNQLNKSPQADRIRQAIRRLEVCLSAAEAEGHYCPLTNIMLSRLETAVISLGEMYRS